MGVETRTDLSRGTVETLAGDAGTDALAVSTLRFLAADMVEAAQSGHPGLPMGAAPMAWVLFSRHLRHDPTDEIAAFKLASEAWPGKFGVFYENKNRPTKNALEQKLIANIREKTKSASDLELLSKTFAKMR